ncbi:MAG: transporter substrate-binding domain-containing protein [Colwellia sp.]|nr:transporter substrate-binding domain-containing protein [Colwellia sp.]
MAKILNYSRPIIALLYFCVFFSSSEQIKENKNDVIMITMEQIPYGYLSSEGKTIGVLYDILNEIIRDSGIGQVNQLMPPKRIFSYMMKKQKVCSLLAGVPSIVSNFDLIEPIGYELTAGILPKAGIKLVNYSDLKNITIAVPLGIKINSKFNSDASLIKVHPPEYLNAIRMLKKGRVDAIAGAVSNLLYIAKLEGMQLDVFDKPFVFSRIGVYLVCSKSLDKSIRNKLKQSVIRLKLAGIIQKTLDRYFKPTW